MKVSNTQTIELCFCIDLTGFVVLQYVRGGYTLEIRLEDDLLYTHAQ